MRVYELLAHILDITKGDTLSPVALDEGIPRYIPKEAFKVDKGFLLIDLSKIPERRKDGRQQ